MYTGSFSGDMVVGGALARASQAQGALQETKRVLAEVIEGNACNLGIRYALAVQLARWDPTNPLLTDKSLLERLKRASQTAYNLSPEGFDASREVGRTFVIPGREGPVAVVPVATPPPSPDPVVRVAPPQLLKKPELDHEAYRAQYAGILALRNAMGTALCKHDPDHPLLKDIDLMERVRDEGAKAYKISGGDYSAAREVGSSFPIPGR